MASSLSYLIGQPLIWVPTATFKARYDLIAPDNTALESACDCPRRDTLDAERELDRAQDCYLSG